MSGLAQSLFDGSSERLRYMRTAPGESRTRVHPKANENAGERLRLHVRPRNLFVSACAGRRMCVNDRPPRSALRLELSENGGSGPSGPGSLHAAGCIAVARGRPMGTAMDLQAAPLAEEDLELAHALMVTDASPEPVTPQPFIM